MDPVLFSPQRAPKRVQPEMDTMGLPMERLCFPVVENLDHSRMCRER